MKEVLVIGSGAREHALVWKIAQSSLVDQIYCAPGNPGVSKMAECVPLTSTLGLVNFAKQREIDLTIVGPEKFLEEGVVDLFKDNGLAIIGPKKAAAQIETSKIFAKKLMVENNIPTAFYQFFNPSNKSRALRYIREHPLPLMIKEDGLAVGKGVSKVEDEKTALSLANDYLSHGKSILIEEYLEGLEVSTTAICHDRNFIPLLLTYDHKQIFEGGPNTGGMGVYTPLPFVNSETERNLYEVITRPILNILANQGKEFTGFLYPNIMLTATGPKVLEYNARFGDPETQAVLSLMDEDLFEVLEMILDEQVPKNILKFLNKFAVSLSLVSAGYPHDYEAGKVIEGVEVAERIEDIIVFHAGTKNADGKLVTAGGRVLSIVAIGGSLEEAVKKVYNAAEQIHFEGMYYRKDIARRALSG